MGFRFFQAFFEIPVNFISIDHLLFASNGELINCKIIIDILEGQKRQGWVFQRSTTQKSCSESRTNNRKSKTVQAETKKAATTTGKVQTRNRTSSSKLYKQQQHSSTNMKNSNTNILQGQKRAKIGFSTVGDLKAPAAAATTKAETTVQAEIKKSSKNNRKIKSRTRRSKLHKQQHKQHQLAAKAATAAAQT